MYSWAGIISQNGTRTHDGAAVCYVRVHMHVCVRKYVRECVVRTQQVSISDGVRKSTQNGYAQADECVRAPTSIRRMHFFVEMTLSAQYNLPRIYNLHVQSRGDID